MLSELHQISEIIGSVAIVYGVYLLDKHICKNDHSEIIEYINKVNSSLKNNTNKFIKLVVSEKKKLDETCIKMVEEYYNVNQDDVQETEVQNTTVVEKNDIPNEEEEQVQSEEQKEIKEEEKTPVEEQKEMPVQENTPIEEEKKETPVEEQPNTDNIEKVNSENLPEPENNIENESKTENLPEQKETKSSWYKYW